MSEIPEDIKKMDERISAIRAKEKAKSAKNSDKHTNFSHIAVVLQMAIELASGTFVGAGIGYILDELFDFKSVFLLIFTVFGGIAGLVNMARYLKRIDEEGK